MCKDLEEQPAGEDNSCKGPEEEMHLVSEEQQRGQVLGQLSLQRTGGEEGLPETTKAWPVRWGHAGIS